jgi:hypothetical protein
MKVYRANDISCTRPSPVKSAYRKLAFGGGVGSKTVLTGTKEIFQENSASL